MPPLKPLHSPSPESGRKGWVRRFLPFLSVMLLLAGSFAVILWSRQFLIPVSLPAFHAQLEQRLGERLGADVEIGEAGLQIGRNPGLWIKGFRVLNASSRELLLESPQAVVRMNWNEFFRGRLEPLGVEWAGASLRPEPVFAAMRRAAFSPAVPRASSGVAGDLLPLPLALTGHQNHLQFRPSPEIYPAFSALTDYVVEAAGTDRWRIDAYGDVNEDENRDFALRGVYDAPADALYVQLAYADQTWMADGFLKQPGQNPVFEGTLDLSPEDPSEIFSQLDPELPRVEGELNLELEGRIPLRGDKPLKESVVLKGAMDLRNGRWKGLNPVATALETLLGTAGDTRKASELGSLVFPELLDSGDLPFELAQAGLEIVKGTVYLQHAVVKHSQYLMELDGQLVMPRREVELRGKIVFLEKLSKTLAEEFPYLQNLLNEHGRIVLPFACRGLMPHADFRMDTEYLQARVSDGTVSAGNENKV